MGRRKKKLRKKQRDRAAKGAPPAAEAEPIERVAAEQAVPQTVAGAGTPEPSRLRRWLPFAVGLAVVAAIFLVLKMFAINPYAGDEHIYTYQAQLVSEGVTPYEEFAMAHPPLQSLVTGILLKIIGYDFTFVRLLPILWCLAAGCLLALMVRRELGSVAAVMAAALYLLAYEPIRASSHATGVNMTLALLLGAFLAYRTQRIAVCAGLCVAAVFTRLYAAPGVMALVVWALVADRRQGLRLIAWGAGLGALAFVAFGIWTGFGEMIHNMLRYHAQKTPMKPESLANMKDNVLFHNALQALMFLLGGLALFAALVRSYNRVEGARSGWQRFRAAITSAGLGLPLLAAGTAVLFLLVLINMDRVWMYYFVPSFPFAAIVGGWLVSRWLGTAAALLRARGKLAKAGIDKPALLGYGALLAALAIGFALSPMLEARLSYYKKAMRKDPARRVHTYQWQPGMLPDFLNDLVRATVWSDERTIGETYTGFSYLLWHESRVFDIAEEMVEQIERRTNDDEEIFGDSGTVPLLALLADRRIAGNEVDTNIQRYRSGNADPDELIERIDSPQTKLIILRQRFGVSGVAQVRQLTRDKYRAVKTLTSKQGRRFTIYERRLEKGEQSR
jgi:hypothetical protein